MLKYIEICINMLNTRISWHFPHQEGGLVEEAPQENRRGCHHRPGFSKDCRDAPHHRDEQCHAKERHHLQVIQWKGAACLGMHGIACLRLLQIASDCFNAHWKSTISHNLPKMNSKKAEAGQLQSLGQHPTPAGFWASPASNKLNVSTPTMIRAQRACGSKPKVLIPVKVVQGCPR